MSASKLKINPDKTYYLFGSKRQRDKLKAYFPSTILGSPLCPDESVKNLDVWFDSDFSLSKYVRNVSKSCFVQLRVRRFLTHDASVLVAKCKQFEIQQSGDHHMIFHVTTLRQY